MKRYFRKGKKEKYLVWPLVLLLLIQVIMPVASFALSEGSMNVGIDINKWHVDEAAGVIYAISESSSELKVIDMETLAITKTVALGQGPSDIEAYNGSLYISLNTGNSIAVFDTATQEVTGTIATTDSPYSVAIDDDKLFYTKKSSFGSIYCIDLTTEAETTLTGVGTHYAADLSVDRDNNVLYIGESGLSGSKLSTFSTVDYSEIYIAPYPDGNKFSYPKRRMVFDGAELFYAGYSFDASDVEVINGTFKENYTAKVLAVNTGYVVTTEAVYSRSTFEQIAGLPFTAAEAFLSSDNTLVLYDDYNQKIQKINVNSLSGYSEGSSAVYGQIDLVDWNYDEATGLLYAISSERNSLLKLDPSASKVVEEVFVGSMPSDIEEYNGKFYIPLFGATKIAVVDKATMTVDKHINVTQYPFRVVADDDKLIYAQEDQHCYLFEVDLISGTETKLSEIGTVYEPDIAIDRINNVLYIGESGSSGSDILTYSTVDYSTIYTPPYPDGIDFSYPKRNILVDDAEIFYAGRSFDKADVEVIFGTYGGTVLAANSQYVVTQTDVYDRDDYVSVASLPYTASKAAILSDNTLILYNDDNKQLEVQTLDFDSTYTTQDSSFFHEISLEDSTITDWIFDETNSKIYAISKDQNKLMEIDPATEVVTRELIIGSKPSDIEIYEGKLYIPLFGSTMIAVVDQGTFTLESSWAVSQYPYMLEIDDDKLFYTQMDQWCYIFVLDLNTGIEEKLSIGSFYQPALAMDRANNILYVGESGISSGDIYAVNTADYSTTRSADSQSYPSRKLILDDNTLHYDGVAISASDLSTVLAIYDGTVLHAQNGEVFTANNYYSASDGSVTPIDQPSLVLTNNVGNLFMYYEDALGNSIDIYSNLEQIKLDTGILGFKQAYIDSENSTIHFEYDTVSGTAIKTLYAEPLNDPSVPVAISSGTDIAVDIPIVVGETHASFGGVLVPISTIRQVEDYTYEGQVISGSSIVLESPIYFSGTTDESGVESPFGSFYYIDEFIVGSIQEPESPEEPVLSDDATLSNVTVSTGALDPLFDSNTIVYEIMVEDTVEEITVSAYAASSGSSITIDSLSVSELTIPLDFSANFIPIDVVSEDLSTEMSYLLIVYRPSVVQSFDLSSLNITGGSLVPNYDPGVNKYSITVPYETINLGINAIPVDPDAKVMVGLTGTSSETVNLNVGLNQVNIYVHDWSYNETKMITLNITRQEYVDSGGGSTGGSSGGGGGGGGGSAPSDSSTSEDSETVKEVIEFIEKIEFNFDSDRELVDLDEKIDSIEALLERDTLTENDAVKVVDSFIDALVENKSIELNADTDEQNGIDQAIEALINKVYENVGTVEQNVEQSGDKVIISVDDAALQVAKVVRMQRKLSNALEDGTKNDLAQAVEKAITVALDEIDDMEVRLKEQALGSLSGNGVGVRIKTEPLNFVLPAGFNEFDDSKEVKVSISKFKGNVKAVDNLNVVGDILDLDIYSDGEKITEFDKAPQLEFDVKAYPNPNKLSIYVYNDDDESWEYIEAKHVGDKLIVKAPHFSKYAVLELSGQFADIELHWAEDFIQEMAMRQLIGGYEDGSFRPQSQISRAEVAQIFVNILDLEAMKGARVKGVDQSAWYADAVNAAAQAGLILDLENYKADDAASRKEIAYMTAKAFEKRNGKTQPYSPAPFSDISEVSQNVKDAVNLTHAKNIISGYPDNTFRGSESATRAEVVTMAIKLLNQ